VPRARGAGPSAGLSAGFSLALRRGKGRPVNSIVTGLTHLNWWVAPRRRGDVDGAPAPRRPRGFAHP